MQLAQNYRINLISPYTLTEEQLEKLKSKLKEAMIFIKYSQNKQKLADAIEQDPMFHNMDRDTVAMLNELTGADIKISHREEKVDMCLAIQQMMDESVEKGIGIGREKYKEEFKAEGRAEGRAEGILGSIQLLRSANISDDMIEGMVKDQYSLTDEKTREYMELAKE